MLETDSLLAAAVIAGVVACFENLDARSTTTQHHELIGLVTIENTGAVEAEMAGVKFLNLDRIPAVQR